MLKPGKNGHINAKDIRPINLMSFLLKTWGRMLHMFLKNGPLLKHPLDAFQCAYKEGRSTETALHQVVSKVEIQLEVKGYAIVSFLGVEGAYDGTFMEAIKQAMIRHEVPEVLVDWIEDMLADRNLTQLGGYNRRR